MSAFQSPGRSTLYAANGAAATSHPLGAKVAVQMLEEGGNAVDAAIAAAVLLGLCEPQMTGIGGDMFALIKPAGSDEVLGLNGSGRAPKGLDAGRLRGQGHSAMPDLSGETVVVPGAIAGLAALSAAHGQKGLQASLAPAIRYAREGIPVAPRVAHDWRDAAGRLQGHARRHYLGDSVPVAGTRFFAPGQADLLERIAADGPAAFYQGEAAEDMVAALNAHGGQHTLEDFAACTADWVEPISADYRGTEVIELPPNGHGATALLMLKMLEGHDIAAMDPWGAERVHLEAEATKLAYAARDEAIADPEHMVIGLDTFLGAGTVERLRGRIDPDRAMDWPTDPLGGQRHRDTIYITVVDKDRMVVSLIYSIFASFGSGIASEKFGVLFNNRAAGFNLREGHANEAKGGKRPLHTIIPGMTRVNGKVTMGFGVMGGPYQPCGHARLISNMVDFGLGPQQAIDAPRSFSDRVDGLKLESGYGEEIATALAAKGHKVMRPGSGIGGAQAIVLAENGDILVGGSDPRKDGIALGY